MMKVKTNPGNLQDICKIAFIFLTAGVLILAVLNFFPFQTVLKRTLILDSHYNFLNSKIVTTSPAVTRQRTTAVPKIQKKKEPKYRKYPLNTTFLKNSRKFLIPFLRGYAGNNETRALQMLAKSIPDIDYSIIKPHTISGRNLSFAEVHKSIEDGKLVPSAAHFVLPFIKPELEFHHLICILSGYWIFKPKKLFLWYNDMPRGKYWNVLRKNITDFENKVIMVHRPLVKTVYNNVVGVREHKADVVRLEALIVFGGAYFDVDVVILKSMDPLRKYPFTIGRESGSGLCNGVMVGAPNSTFLSLWHLAYQIFYDPGWALHSVMLPNFMASVPALRTHVRVEEISMDQPSWAQTDIIYGHQRSWDWKKNNYCMHLWYRFHNKHYNFQSIKLVDSMFGDIFRKIIFGDERLNFGKPLPYPTYRMNVNFLDKSRKDLEGIFKIAGLPFATNKQWFSRPAIPFGAFQLHSPSGIKMSVEDILPIIHEKNYKIPNAVHFVLPSEKPKLEFHQLMAVLSAYWIASPRRIFIWYDEKPSGTWWEVCKTKIINFEANVIMVHRPRLATTYDAKVYNDDYKSHVIRLEALVLIGGIFIDLNVITLKNLDSLRKSELVIGGANDVSLSNQFIMSTPYNSYISLWHLTYQKFKDKDFDVFASEMPFLIARQWPKLANVTEGYFCDEESDNVDKATPKSFRDLLRSDRRVLCLPTKLKLVENYKNWKSFKQSKKYSFFKDLWKYMLQKRT